MNPLDAFSSRWPNIHQEALDRLLGDKSLYNPRSSHLQEWVKSKEHARAILLVANHIASNCAMKLRFEGREIRLMGRKFVI